MQQQKKSKCKRNGWKIYEKSRILQMQRSQKLDAKKFANDWKINWKWKLKGK